MERLKEFLAEVYFDIATGNDFLDEGMLREARAELEAKDEVIQAAQEVIEWVQNGGEMRISKPVAGVEYKTPGTEAFKKLSAALDALHEKQLQR